MPAQNLLPNPSFEITAVPKVTPLYLPASWVIPTQGSPDLMTPLHSDGVPQNFAGYQFAHSGNNYLGLLMYSLFQSNDSKRFREYIQNEMTESLVQDSTYCLQLFVSLADSFIFASKNKLGVYFSTSKIQSNDFFYLPFTPQIMVSPDSFLQEKQEWLEFNFEYKASGGEKYITIGNFTDSTEVDTLFVGGNRSEPNNIGTYYYIDDVYLGSCDSIPFDTNVGLQEQSLIQRNHNLFPNPATNQVNLAFEVKPNEQFSFLLYDLQGRLVQMQLLKVGNEHRIALEKDCFVPRNRLYLYQIRNAKGEFLSGKLVIE
ncbi:MAG: hypothetical protein ACJAV5_000560 [Vicingaceae bacterium]|jgi:hypothetical protein